jgi:putative transposase
MDNHFLWSNTIAHINGKDDILVKTKPLLAMVNKPWRNFLSVDAQAVEIELFKRHERSLKFLMPQHN